MANRKPITNRRSFIKGTGGLATMLALGAPAVIAQTGPKKLILAHNGPPPELGALTQQWFSEQVTKRSNGELLVDFQGGTILTKEIEIINAVKTGNVAIGSPVGAAATVFPEMGLFLVPYLVSSYDQAYKLFNGEVGDQLDKTLQEKYGIKILYFYDLGFRHFWNSRRPINDPRDLRGLKLRTQPSKVFADSINGLGGVAVPLPWAEVVTAAQQGVIDGADLPVANMVPLKAYEMSKYYSLTFHNYGPTVLTMNLALWKSMTSGQQKLLLDVGRETQGRMRTAMEGADNFESAKKLLEPHGMIVNKPDIAPFKAIAQSKIWPNYQSQYPDLWQKITSTTS